MTSAKHCGLGALLGVLGFVLPAWASVEYVVTDFDWGVPTAINNLGQVVGKTHYPVRPVLWEDGVTTVLWNVEQGIARGINDRGQVVGDGIFGSERHPFIWDNGLLTDLSWSLGSGVWLCQVNEVGHLVGLSAGDLRAFVWMDGVKVDLGDLGGDESVAFAINNAGQAVGGSAIETGQLHPFLWDAHNGMQDLGFTGYANAINDAGQVVGLFGSGDNDYGPFLWDEVDGMRPLGTLGGTRGNAYSINSSSEIVGASQVSTDPSAPFHAFLWKDGVMLDLNRLIPPDSGWELEAGLDMNDVGQIIGRGIIDDQQHGFLLTPVPEPATIVFVALGALAATRRSRR